jgi:hypothetical protein
MLGAPSLWLLGAVWLDRDWGRRGTRGGLVGGVVSMVLA